MRQFEKTKNLTISQFCLASDCLVCSINGNPKKDQKLIVYKRSTNSYEHLSEEEAAPFTNGHTPHMFIVVGEKNGIISYDVKCCCCDIEVKEAFNLARRKKEKVLIISNLKEKATTTLIKWNQMAKHSF